MQGPALCAFGIALLTASLALGSQKDSRKRDRASLALAALAGVLVPSGFFYLVVPA
jgi:hypothetical protein